MKQRDEDGKVTQSELEQIKKQMKLTNLTTLKQIRTVYKSISLTKEQLDKGILINFTFLLRF